MGRNQRQTRGELTIEDLNVGVTEARRVNLDKQLIWVY
jgi:hypothetical protein